MKITDFKTLVVNSRMRYWIFAACAINRLATCCSPT